MILKVRKNQFFTLSLRNLDAKPQGGGQIDPPAFLGLIFLKFFGFMSRNLLI